MLHRTSCKCVAQDILISCKRMRAMSAITRTKKTITSAEQNKGGMNRRKRHLSDVDDRKAGYAEGEKAVVQYPIKLHINKITTKKSSSRCRSAITVTTSTQQPTTMLE